MAKFLQIRVKTISQKHQLGIPTLNTNNMNNEQLTIKHLVPYLLYGLKCYSENIHPIREITVQDSLSSWILWMTVNNSKLLLRPLSDLTKEIEVNGESFVPSETFPELEISFNTCFCFFDFII